MQLQGGQQETLVEAVYFVMTQLAQHLNCTQLDSLLARGASLPPQEVDVKVVHLVSELLTTAMQDPEYIKARALIVLSRALSLVT